MLMPGRKFSSSSLYRYGFNGKENDNEVKGEGNQQDYGMRIYDPRLGKFLSVDPLTVSYPWYTPYQFAGNNPIKFIDVDGMEPGINDEYSKTDLEKNPNYTGLTLVMLRQQAASSTSLSLFDWRTNVIAGIALEDAFQDFSERNKNYRLFQNKYRAASVRPDFVSYSKATFAYEDEPYKPAKNKPPIKLTHGTFFEVKATVNEISPETSKGQIGGMIDALSRMRGTKGEGYKKNAPGLARLIFVVPYGTKFSESLITEATRKGVELYVSYAFQNLNTKEVTFSNAQKLTMVGPFIGGGTDLSMHSNNMYFTIFRKIFDDQNNLDSGKLEFNRFFNFLRSNENEVQEQPKIPFIK
jgi:RHS repeat-associated protein